MTFKQKKTCPYVVTLISAIFAATAWAEGDVATVNGVLIPQVQMDFLVSNFVEKGAKDGETLRKQLSEELIAREAVAQETIKLGLDKSPEMTAAFANAKRDLLVNAFQANYAAKHPISDEEIQALYDQQKMGAGDKEYRIRHVLVKTEAEAKEILVALKKGAKFETLAREKSQDSASRAAGGDIGWQVPVTLVPTVRDAIKTLSKGQPSEPVQSSFGWHVLKVEDVRVFEFPAIDKVKVSLQQQLQTQAALRAIAEIRKNAQVK
jgi:peptidyl-prolyl cis-trans isomerase C